MIHYLKKSLVLCVIALFSLNSGWTQDRFDRFDLKDKSRIWIGLKKWIEESPDRKKIWKQRVPDNISSLCFYRFWNDRQEIDWEKSKMFVKYELDKINHSREFKLSYSLPNALKELIETQAKKTAEGSQKKEGKWSPSALPDSICLCDYLTKTSEDTCFLTFKQFISFLDTMLVFRINQPNIKFDRADISLRPETNNLKISSMNYMTSRALPDRKPIVSVMLAPWVKNCFPRDLPNLKLHYTTNDADNYYFDPEDLQNILKSYRQNSNSGGSIEVNLYPVKTSIPPDPDEVFLPAHTIWQRSMALLGPRNQDNLSNDPLYNTSFSSKSAKWFRGFWEDEKKISKRSPVEIKDTSKILSQPGFYSFKAPDTEYQVHNESRIREGNLVILPDLGTTNLFSTIDKAVSDINFRHEIHLKKHVKNGGYTQVVDDTSRYVLSKNIGIDIEPNSKKLIDVKVTDQPFKVNGQKVDSTYAVEIRAPSKDKSDPFMIADNLNKKTKTKLYTEDMQYSERKKYSKNVVAKAYFRYVDSNNNPLQPKLGVSVNDEFCHVVYIYPPLIESIDPFPPKDKLDKTVSTIFTMLSSITGAVLLAIAL
ncbi:MAG: hypothetical protein P9X24_03280 [Candidatus Hatepunaea meridiana]|nr:hypothetical protein [Candidatus Hatepunaea meridiana]